MRIFPSVVALVLAPLVLGSVSHGRETWPGPEPVRHPLRWPQPALGASRSGAAEVLFTFDDGPENGSTEKILDTLRAHGVHALFFLVGRHFNGKEPRSRDIVQRMLDERHVVGNHTIHHAHLCLRSTDLDAEIDGNAALVRTVTGMHPAFFRAPYGARCARLERELAARSLKHLHWDVDPQEWKSHDANRTAAIVISKIRNLGDGQRAVVLIHDTHPATAGAVPRILDWIDAENARRVQAGRRPIRILDPADIALEQLAPGVEEALGVTASTTLDLVPTLARRFLSPMSPPIAKVRF